MIDLSRDVAELSIERRQLLELLLEQEGIDLDSVMLSPRRSLQFAPLSYTQQRLWVTGQMAAGTAFGNLPLAFLLQGPLDQDAFRESVTKIVQRHAILRTTFAVADGQPEQRIAPSGEVRMQIEDLHQLANSEKLAEAKRRAHEEAHTPFDLGKDPLFRVFLYRLDPEEHLVLFLTHHMATDGWGIRVLLRELSTLYRAAVDDRQPQLPDLPIRYADFAVWQREWTRGNAAMEQLSYWERQLARAPRYLQLPVDRKRPARPSFDAGSVPIRIQAPLAGNLRALALREEVTPYTMLFSALFALLYGKSGQQDMVIGTIISNRSLSETENIVGNFGNNMPIRVSIAGDPTFETLVRRVNDAVLDAHAHQDLPLEKLAEAKRKGGIASGLPLFQLAFLMRDTPLAPTLDMPEVTVKSVPITVGLSRLDLTLDITDEVEVMVGFLEYNTALFEKESIVGLVEDYLRILKAVVTNPGIRVVGLTRGSGVPRKAKGDGGDPPDRKIYIEDGGKTRTGHG